MKAQLWKVVKGALVAAAGAGLTYLIEMTSNMDFGTWTPMVVAALSVIVNIIRKVLPVAVARTVVKTLVVLALLAVPLHAQNLVPPFSHGPTIPFYTISWDKTGEMSSDFLVAGAGYSFNFNRLLDNSGTISKLTVGVPVFFNVAGNGEAPATTRFFAGLTVGTYNNLLAFGPALKFFEATEGESPTGIFQNGLKKENVALLFSFNINFGAGVQASTARRAGSVMYGKGDRVGPPPNYIKFW